MSAVFSLFGLEQRIVRRSRTVRGARFAGLALAFSTPVPLGVAVTRSFGVAPADPALLTCAFLFPIFCALVAFLLGRAKEPDLPRLLLAIDLALTTGERLSSLHELRRTGGGRPFRRRIEERLKDLPLHWKKGLPFGSVSLLSLVAGGLVLAGTGALVALRPVSASGLLQSPLLLPPRVERAAERATRPPSTAPTVLPQETGPQSDTAPPTEGMPTQGLDDVLSGIWESPGSQGILSDGRGTDLSNLAEEQERLARALSRLLSQIEERLKEESGPLTKEEREALSDLLSEVGDGTLRQALRSLLAEESPEPLEEGLERMRSLSQGGEAALADTGGEPQRGVLPPSAKAEEGQVPAWEPSAGNEVPGFGGRAGPSAQAESQSESAEEDEAAGGTDESAVGGRENASVGSGAPVGTQSGRSAGFIPEDLAGTIGESGAFREFITKGVPLEPVPQANGEGMRLALDYEALRAILEGRALSPTAEETVRTYFQTITQGGP